MGNLRKKESRPEVQISSIFLISWKIKIKIFIDILKT